MNLMTEHITVEAAREPSDGYERIQEAFGLVDFCERVRGCFMRDAEDEFARAGYEQTSRVVVGDVIRYTFERRQP
ncbi:MAG: hypothetical protein L6Q35_09155 [Phycisphaerales bacterium]|nr:hypothetical protein [Phycisphaerales bacterium]